MVKELLKKYKGVILYLIFGAITTVINVVSYHVFYKYMNVSNVLSTCIAWGVAVVFAFVTNKLFVFESKKKNSEALKEAVGFIACRMGSGVVELGIMWLFVDLMNFNGTVMKLVTNVIVIILNYLASKFLVFRGEGNV